MISTHRLATFVFALAVLVPGTVQGQNQMDDVEIEVVELNPNLYVLYGQGGNIGLSIGEDGAFLIDDQFAPLTEKIKAAVASVTDLPVEFVLNTHWHGDHTGGNENFGGEGAMIVAHDNVYRRMNPADFPEVAGSTGQAPSVALPRITFSESMTFHWNGEDIFVHHPDPAHTDGDAVVFFTTQNIVHMGDTFFNGFYPFIDVNSGGDVDGMIGVANTVLERSDSRTRIIPGHGPVSGPADLRAYRDMLIDVRDRVLEMKNSGRTEDEVVESVPTAEHDPVWNTRGGTDWRDNMVRFIYRSVGG